MTLRSIELIPSHSKQQLNWIFQFRLLSVLWVLASGILFVPGGLLADEKQLELAELVPGRVGLAIEARSLTGAAKKALQSQLAERIQQHSAWQQILSGSEFRKLRDFNQGILNATGHSLAEWIDAVVGRDAILAISSNAIAKNSSPKVDSDDDSKSNSDDASQSGRGTSFLLVTRLQDRDRLQSILQAWEKLEPSLESQFDYQGTAYFSRKKDVQSDVVVYYTLLDEVLIISNHEASLKEVLDLSKRPKQASSLQHSERFQKSIQDLHPDSIVRVFIQPEAWTGEFNDETAKPTDFGERLIQQAWLRCRAIGIGVRLNSGIVAEAVVYSDQLSANPFWNEFVRHTSGNPAFLARVPKQAIVAFGGRHDFSRIANWAVQQLPPEQAKQAKSVRQMVKGLMLGQDLLDDILPSLPTDFGGFIVPRQVLDSAALPVDGLIALTLPAKETTDLTSAKASIRGSLSNAAETGFSMLTALYNASSKGDAELKDEDSNGVSIYWIDSLGPYQPAFAVSHDVFLLASSPQLIRNFVNQSQTDTWASQPDLKRFRDATFPDASQVLAFHSRLAREFANGNRAFFIKQLVSTHRLSETEANKRLDRMLEWIELSDAVVLATTFTSDSVKVVLGIAIDDLGARP